MPHSIDGTFRRSFKTNSMDEKDRLLLTYLQNGLPLTPRPFEGWSAKIGLDSAELLVRIQRLKKEGTFGGIRAILDPRAFHYQGAWVAARFEPEGLVSAAEVFSRHPGVIYICEREHEFNLWFFITVPEGQDLELHVRCLGKLSGARRTLLLPVRKVFKGSDLLNSLDGETFPAMGEHFEKRQTAGSLDWTAAEIEMIRKLQEPFPLTDEPYQKIAADFGITEAQVLETMKALVKKGCLKRIGSFSKHGAAPSSAKTWVVWQIPEEKLERIGLEIAEFTEVLYADWRPAFSELPYSLYGVVRAGAPEEIEGLARRMQERIGKWPYRVMVTVLELKKERIRYFPKEMDAWWRESHHVEETAFH